jgi:hypothetical protein
VGIAKDLLEGERLESNLDICLVVIVVVVVVSIIVLYRQHRNTIGGYGELTGG